MLVLIHSPLRHMVEVHSLDTNLRSLSSGFSAPLGVAPRLWFLLRWSFTRLSYSKERRLASKVRRPVCTLVLWRRSAELL